MNKVTIEKDKLEALNNGVTIRENLIIKMALKLPLSLYEQNFINELTSKARTRFKLSKIIYG